MQLTITNGITFADGVSTGLAFANGTVRKKDGLTKVVINGTARLPKVANLDDAIAFFGEPAIAGSLNGTSFMVVAQRVNRTILQGKGAKDAPTIDEAIINAFRGIRSSTTVTQVIEKIVKQYAIPGSAPYTGTDLMEYKQLYLASLVDAGVDISVAQGIVATLTL